MSTQQEMNQKYTQACAELGDITYKLMDLRDQRATLEDQIDALEAKSKAYRNVRTDLQRALAEAQIVAAKEDTSVVETEPT